MFVVRGGDGRLILSPLWHEARADKVTKMLLRLSILDHVSETLSRLVLSMIASKTREEPVIV